MLSICQFDNSLLSYPIDLSGTKEKVDYAKTLPPAERFCSATQTAIYRLRRILEGVSDSRSLIFHSKNGGPLLATNILNQDFMQL